MAKPTPVTIDDYMASEPEPLREALEVVRSSIHKAVPAAQEAIAYRMPAFKLRGKVVVYFAGWKNHYSIYPAGSQAVLAAFKDELDAYKVEKGTIRFSITDPVPMDLIERIASFRATEIEKTASLGAKSPR